MVLSSMKLVGFALAVATASAQAASVYQGDGAACPASPEMIGISGVRCENCTYHTMAGDPANAWWRFGSEPTIIAIQKGTPAADKLRQGDIIVAVDGHLITTSTGGERFARLEAGEAVVVTVRRGGRELDVNLTPVTPCGGPSGATGLEGGDLGMARRVSAAERAARTAAQQERGWLGLSFTCKDCVIASQGNDERIVSSPGGLTIHDVVSGGPAHLAGVRTGDVLTHVQGHHVGTQEAWTAADRLRPGDRVVLTVTRSGRQHDLVTAAGARPARHEVSEMLRADSLAVRGVAARSSAVAQGNVSFVGSLGDVRIEVTGPVTVTKTDEEVLIEGENITVRLRRR
jgi:S1-C subfamily serine protease